ncbi:acyl-CoA dehydrogenase family protein [Halorientalis pallida]|uniref:Acyl-CoA dehydrogenase n=1 Tax=Halorientalis pallida TaxID=2479928 RepID=A0A498KV34_9EURY|nr:acyl-CoA dehydrogenase family protein [Halorientalis pallida]RXK49128.1 acyl-CoA dehydrogenase [Halorientalis pallida]
MVDTPIDYSRYEAGRHVNYWELDLALQAEVERTYPGAEFEWAEPELSDLGELTGHTITDNAAIIDREGHELRTYDEHGEVQNHVQYHPLQHENDQLVYDRGVTHDVFHAPPGRDDPLGFQHVLSQQTILSFADGGFVCPVSMTTGAAIVLEKYVDDDHPNADLLDEYFRGLTNRDYDDHIEGAMFLTEKQGGSDVGANETTAEPTDEEGIYELHGEKWFCSNIDAEGTLALARRPDAPDGTAGLSLFLVPHTKQDGSLNDQLYRRLKDKLGTIAVPTGEVEFRGAEAYLVGEPENGFKLMAEMMNFERLTNATGSVGGMGRCLLESKVQAATRDAFGETIQEYPLMRRDLVNMQTDYEAALAFTFEATRHYADYMANEQRLDESPEDRDDDAARAFKLMRLLVPIAKYKTARMAVDTASYACEILGGNGYVNGFTTERMLRDSQVLPIWEGTSNVLSLDVLRVLNREAAHEELFPLVEDALDTADHPHLDDLAATVAEEFEDMQAAMLSLATEDQEYAQHEAKQLADYIFDVVTAALLIERAQDAIDERDDARKALVAEWFVETRFAKQDARGITDGEKLPDDHFAEMVRHGSLSPDRLAQAAPADD